MSIREKIIELFEYRKLPFLVEDYRLRGSGIMEELIDLQHIIFLYDKYLEENWVLDQEELGRRWKAVLEKLIEMGLSKEEAIFEARHIEVYSRNEQSTRSGFHLSELPIKYFYYYKSCDVKLLRRLLYRFRKTRQPLTTPNDWFVFDFVTEVNDDISDVHEDRGTFNGNRFLDRINQSGSDMAYKEYARFLIYLGSKVTESQSTGNEELDISMRRWVRHEIKTTSVLLENELIGLKNEVIHSN